MITDDTENVELSLMILNMLNKPRKEVFKDLKCTEFSIIDYLECGCLFREKATLENTANL